MIKLEYLRVFATVAETQALSEAAERLGRTPSAISMTLKQIEESLGGPLFAGERKAALTPLGAFALGHARRAVAEHDAATAAIQRFARREVCGMCCVDQLKPPPKPVIRPFRGSCAKWPSSDSQ